MPTVKKILPQSKELPLKKIAAYCRVSTKAQERLVNLVHQSATMRIKSGHTRITYFQEVGLQKKQQEINASKIFESNSHIEKRIEKSH